MKKILSLVLATILVLGCMSFAMAEGPDTYSMIANFDITTLDYV